MCTICKKERTTYIRKDILSHKWLGMYRLNSFFFFLVKPVVSKKINIQTSDKSLPKGVFSHVVVVALNYNHL